MSTILMPLSAASAPLAATALFWGGWRMRAQRGRRGLVDRLTGLPNQRMFDSRVEHALIRARRHGQQVAVLAIDIDELATVNNLMGRECGDQLIRDASEKLRSVAREEDTVARISSDEFAVLLEQVDGPTGAARAAQRILDAFHVPTVIEGRAVAATVSIGMSITDDADHRSLVGEAGIALARAKATGKRRLEIYEPSMGHAVSRRLSLEADLQQAVANGELLVHYQPVFDMSADTIVGAEALARWAHPDRGMLPPAEFIAIAEHCGAIVGIGRAVLNEACRVAAILRARGMDCFQASVNVSPYQLRDTAGLLADVADALERHRLAPNALTLEITESSLLDDLQATADAVTRLRRSGVNVVLDDFGTGFSPLSYIKDIPVSGLKLDQSFVADLDQPRTAAIIRAIIDVARELQLTVTAEGVETRQQLTMLKALGCRFAQGHYYSDAIPDGALQRAVTGKFRHHHMPRLPSATVDNGQPHQATG